jgi:hypothetical protein
MSSNDDDAINQISDDRALQTSHILVHLFLNRLTLLLRDSVGGDMDLARIGASHIIGAYQGVNAIDLLAVMQMAAFTLTAINTVSATVLEDLPLAAAISGSGGPSRSLLALARDVVRRQPNGETAAGHGASDFKTQWTRRCAAFARGCVAEASALTCRAIQINGPTN